MHLWRGVRRGDDPPPWRRAMTQPMSQPTTTPGLRAGLRGAGGSASQRVARGNEEEEDEQQAAATALTAAQGLQMRDAPKQAASARPVATPAAPAAVSKGGLEFF